eukprot:scaffold3073_cov66-Cylindrotheca_fusiformis.AAC.20
MDGRKKRKRATNGPNFFVYTSHQTPAELPRATLTHLRVDSSVREIPVQAFHGCQGLVHVQLPETLTRIGQGAFESCSRLKRVQFFSDGSLETYCSLNAGTSLEDGEVVVFPENAILQIDNGAFLGCASLRKVVFCSVSTKLGEAAFANCRGLLSVELPEKGFQVIESDLFSACESLTTVKIPSSVIKIGEDAFYRCRSLTSIDFPIGLVEIGVGCFHGCLSLETLRIPSTVSSIGYGAFEHCTGLKYIILPPTLERIENNMLYGCRLLQYIDIPPTVCFIGDCAFYECSSLSHIRIPPSVESIDIYTFLTCSSLISIELPGDILIGITNDEESGDPEFWSVDCPSLVNLDVVEIMPENDAILSCWLFNDSKLGSVVVDEADLRRRLKHRFDKSQLHVLCYYQSYSSSEYAMMQLHTLMDEDPLAATTQTDEFEMTPLHVLSLSQTPNMDMLLTVMNEGNVDHIIRSRDSFGSTPMDYLCLNRMPDSSDVIRRVLQTRFDHLLSLERAWKSDVLEAVNETLAVDWSSRRREIIAVYLKLANYERREVLSLVELYLWKIKIDEVTSKEEMCDREGCRINSGASIVLPHLLPFLDKLDVEDYVGCSLD